MTATGKTQEARCLDTPHEKPSLQGLFQEHCSYVCHSLSRLGVPERNVQDLAHDVFVIVHRQLPSYQPTGSVKAWLFGIARRVAADDRRLWRHRYELLEEPEPANEPSRDPNSEMEARNLVSRALAMLSLDHRAVFVMHEIDELSMPDIALNLEIPLNTAYSRLRLARAQFRAVMDELCQGDVP